MHDQRHSEAVAQGLQRIERGLVDTDGAIAATGDFLRAEIRPAPELFRHVAPVGVVMSGHGFLQK
jgi:hypothetical protein